MVESFNLSSVICHSQSDSCPEAAPSFVVSLNMNTDYGFFQLSRALKSLRDYQIELAMGEEGPAIYQKLPQINYSLLRSLPAHQQRYRELRWKHFDLGIATTCQSPD